MQIKSLRLYHLTIAPWRERDSNPQSSVYETDDLPFVHPASACALEVGIEPTGNRINSTAQLPIVAPPD